MAHRRATIVCLLALAFVACVEAGTTFSAPKKPKNLIFMISDGFSPTSETFARTLAGVDLLPLDTLLKGVVRTYSSDSLITDSAAAATAYSCGAKTYNNAVGVLPPKSAPKPCTTTFEAAKKAGYRTGLVATSRITHATPASFSSHVPSRYEEFDIAYQQAVEQSLDVLFGGGLEKFTKRPDKVNLLDTMQKRGYQTITSLQQFEGSLRSPVIGLFAESHMDYEIDRIHENPITQPSLVQMTAKALELLNKNNDKGFFLMVEGSRIDMAAHINDPVSHFSDIMAYQQTVQMVKEWVTSNPDTLMISVPDHGTGGLSIGRNFHNTTYPPYTWHPEVILRATGSAYKIYEQIMSGVDVRTAVSKWYNLTLTDDQYAAIKAAIDNKQGEDVISRRIGHTISFNAFVAWTTAGHVGVDVQMNGWGQYADEHLRGVMNNIDLGNLVRDLFELDMSSDLARNNTPAVHLARPYREVSDDHMSFTQHD